MQYFIGLLVISLYAFGLPMGLIALNWREGDPSSDFSLLPDTFWESYLVMVGFSPVSTWVIQAGPFLWANEIFYMATSFSIMIVMLNLLIAIISETFMQVYEKKETHARKMQLRFVSVMDKWMIPRSIRKATSQHRYLYIIKPAFGIQEESDIVHQSIVGL